MADHAAKTQVRQLAVERVKAPGGKHEPLVGDLLALSDKIRDSALPSLGVVVQDAKVCAPAVTLSPTHPLPRCLLTLWPGYI